MATVLSADLLQELDSLVEESDRLLSALETVGVCISEVAEKIAARQPLLFQPEQSDANPDSLAG